MKNQSSQIANPVQYADPKKSITIYAPSLVQSVKQPSLIQSERQNNQIYYVTAKPKSPIRIISQTPVVENTSQNDKISFKQSEMKKSQNEIWEKKYQLLMENYEKSMNNSNKINSDYEKLKLRYQKIKEEMDLFGPIEQKVNVLIEENQQLKLDLQEATEKEKELQDCKKRFQDFEMLEIEDMTKRAADYEQNLTNKQKELNELKLKLQKQNDQQFQDVKMNAQLEEALVILGAENERLHSIQKEKFKENDQLKKKILDLEKNITDLKIDKENCQLNDEQTLGIKNELESSYQTVEALQSEINTYKIQYQELMRISSEKDQWHEEIVDLESQIERKNYEIEQFKLKLLQCEGKIDEQKKGLQNLYEFEQKLEDLVKENQRLQNIANNKIEQINNLNAKCQLNEKKLKDAKQWEINSARLDQSIYEKDRQISELNDKIIQYEGRIQQNQQNEIKMKEIINKQEIEQNKINEENQHNKNLLKEKDNNTQQLKDKIKELELNKIEQFNEINSIKYQLSNCQENCSAQQQEIQRLQSLLQQRMNEVSEYKKKYRECESNYQELINNSKFNKNEVQELQEKIQIYSKEIERIYEILKERDSSLNEQKKKISTYELEIQELNYRINEMDQTNEYQKKELGKSMLFMNNQNDEFQEQKSQIFKLRNENELLQGKLKELQGNFDQIQQKNSEQKEELNKTINENRLLKKNNEQSNELADELNKLKESSNKLQAKYLKEKEEKEQQELINSQLGIEYEKEKGRSIAFEHKLKDSEEKINKLQEQINELNEKLQKANSELIKGGSKQNDIDELQQQLQKQKKDIIDKEKLINQLNAKLKELQKDSDELLYFKERCINFETNQKIKEEEIYRLREELKDTSPSSALESLRKQLNQLKNENASLTAQLEILKQYEVQSIELTQYLQQAQDQNNELQTKFNDNMAIFERSNWMASEIQRLTLVLDEKETELAGFKSKYIENSELQKKLEDYLMMVVIVCAEMEALRTRLEEKEKELKESRRTGISRYRANKQEKEGK